MPYHYKFFKLKIRDSEFRNSHAMVISKNKVLLFGGSGVDANFVNEIEISVSMRNSSQLTSKIITTSKSVPRLSHSAVEYNGIMYVFGGRNPETSEIYNDVISYSLGLFFL
jgi:N-acetylneuraminic acid mutarotase